MKKIIFGAMLIVALLLIPGVIFAAEGNMAKIGETEYATLVEAISAVPADNTQTVITLLRDTEEASGFKIKANQNIVIDFAGHVYDASVPLVGSIGTETNGCQLLKGSTVIFKNGTLKSKTAKILIQNYCNLTLTNMIVDTKGGVADYAMSNNCGNVQILGNTSIKSDTVALDMCWWPVGYPEGTQVTINTTGTIQGDIELGEFGTVTDTNNVKSTLNIENINHQGNVVAVREYLKPQLDIKGGTYSSNVSEYLVEGLVGKEINGSFVLGTENKINVENSGNGEVTVDKQEAIKGETVTITAIANEDYEVDSIVVTDVTGRNITVTDNKFEMPDAEVTVKVEFREVIVEDDLGEEDKENTEETEKEDNIENEEDEKTEETEETEDVVTDKIPADKIEENETVVEEAEKDETPKTGASIAFTVFSVIAGISAVGLLTIKKDKARRRK